MTNVNGGSYLDLLIMLSLHIHEGGASTAVPTGISDLVKKVIGFSCDSALTTVSFMSRVEKKLASFSQSMTPALHHVLINEPLTLKQLRNLTVQLRVTANLRSGSGDALPMHSVMLFLNTLYMSTTGDSPETVCTLLDEYAVGGRCS